MKHIVFDMDGVMKVLGNDLRLTSYDDLKMALKEAWKNGKMYVLK